MATNCKKCGKEIPATGKRGRPALTCAECKVKAPKVLTPAAPKTDASTYPVEPVVEVAMPVGTPTGLVPEVK